MQLYPREIVILAKDFSALVNWYRDVLGFDVQKLVDEDYHYCNLDTRTGIRIGIADADEMGVTPSDRGANTVVLQIAVENVEAFFRHVDQNGGSVASGPAYDKKGDFWFGGIKDPEGNPMWVVDLNCP